jgi:assimilatory nitrate reductase catalytic subunit
MGFTGSFDHERPSEIFAEHAGLSAFENNGTRDFDIGFHAAIDSPDYDAMKPFQWPAAEVTAAETKRFFGNGGYYHSDGKARFVAVTATASSRTSNVFPFVLNTGRIRDQWHTMTRTGKPPRLSSHIAEPFAEIHPRDALELGIQNAELVAIESPRGQVVVRALITERQARGSIFAPMHWNDQFASKARIDALVAPLTDPHSGQPASKNVAVSLRPFAASHYGFAVCSTMPDASSVAYWARAKAAGGWRLELGFVEPVEDWITWCRTAFSVLGHIEPLGYTDRQTGDLRLAFFEDGRLLAAMFVSRGPVAVARNWAISQLTEKHFELRRRYAIVAGRPGADRPDPGATVCSCYGVGINQIVAAVRNGCGTVAAVGAKTSAGTNCGSCRSEIGRIIDGCLAAAAE